MATHTASAQFLSTQLASAHLDRWIFAPKPQAQARLRLFCLPLPGEGPSLFDGWPDELPDWVEVDAIKLPGHGGRRREKPYTNLDALTWDLAEALSPALDLPYAIFGHSTGALIGFELARELIRRGEPAPLHLFVSGRRAPHIDDEHFVHYLPDDQFQLEVQRHHSVPDKFFRNGKLRHLPTLRADFALCETHHFFWSKRLPCPITVMGGSGDSEADRTQLQGWQEHTSSTFHLCMFPGDHLFLYQNQRAALRQLKQHLSKSLTQLPPSLESAYEGQLLHETGPQVSHGG